MHITRISIGLAVKAAREALKLTANDLSKQAGISTSSLSRTENGFRGFDLEEAVAISEALGIKVQALVDLANEFEISGAAEERAATIKQLQRSFTETTKVATGILRDIKNGTW